MILAGLEYKFEIEDVIRGRPPHWCSCRCPEYNRDPCYVCNVRPVTRSVEVLTIQAAIDMGMISKEDAMKLIQEEQERNGNNH